MFLYLESGDKRLKEENVRGDEMNRSNASKFLSKIENPLIDDGKVAFRVFEYGNVDEKMRKKKIKTENHPNQTIHDKNTSSDAL